MGSTLACLSNRTDLIAWRSAVLCLAATVPVLISGCVITPPPPTPSQAVRDDIGVVAIVPAQYVPDAKFDIHDRHKEGATSKQAAKTAAGGLVGTAVAAVAMAPVLPAAIAVAVGGLVTAGATAGYAWETSQGIIPAASVAEAESLINQAVATLGVQNALAKQIATMVQTDSLVRLAAVSAQGPDKPADQPDYAPLRAEGIDSVLEVAITEIGFSGCMSDDRECKSPQLLHLDMRAQARLVRVSDGATLFEWPFHYKSGQRQLTNWVVGDGWLLEEEFEVAYRELAQQIYDEVFLVTPIELPITWGDCWLDQVSPTCSLSSCYKVDSLRPTLQWLAFPREIERQKLDPAVLHKIDNVTYDLKIWDEVSELQEQKAFFTERWRGRLVYERIGLATPQHTLEAPLARGSRYYWSVRARFVVEGRLMATRWARGGGPNKCNSNEIDFQTHFYFDTQK